MLSADGLADIKHRLASRYLDTEQMLTDLLHLVETVEQLEAAFEASVKVETSALTSLKRLRDLARAVYQMDCSFALVDRDENEKQQHHKFRQALLALREAVEA